MATYNAVIKKRNTANNGWDSILPITIGDNVLINSDGDNLTSALLDIINKINGSKIYVNVKDYGAKGDGVNDDSNAFNNAIAYLDSIGGGTLLVPQTKSFYNITKVIKVTTNNNISVLGVGNPEIRKTTRELGLHNYVFNFLVPELTTPTNTISVSNITINGIGVPEQWNETEYWDMLTILYGVNIEGKNILVENCSFKNIYGYGTRMTKYDKAIVNNCDYERVGGHWSINNEYDSFGDCVYFGFSQSANSLASVTNTKMVGYPSDRPRLSRIAVTFEFNVGFGFIQNCFMDGYDRGVHVELADKIKLTIDSCEIKRYNVGVFIHTGADTVDITNCIFRQNIGNYSGTSGMIGTHTIETKPKYIRVDKCLFEISADCESFIHGDIVFSDCKFVSDVGTWIMKSTTIKDFQNCEIVGKALYLYQGAIGKFNDCRFVGKTGTSQTCVLRVEGGSVKKFNNCLFTNAFLNIANAENGIEFNDCRFIKDGTIPIVDYANYNVTYLVLNYFTKIILRNCILESNAEFSIQSSNITDVTLLGNNNKIIDGVWGDYDSRVYSKCGTAEFTGDGVLTQFAIAHDLNRDIVEFNVQPMSVDSVAPYFVTATIGHLLINFVTAPPTSSLIKFNWSVQAQQ